MAQPSRHHQRGGAGPDVWAAHPAPAVVTARSAPDKDARLALQARDWLIAHHADNPGLEQMAQHLQVDRFRLSRLFQAHWGLPPHAWLVQWRLSQARRQLAQGQPVADVAAALGFADQSHLGRWFKRACQLTPSRYQHACTNLQTWVKPLATMRF